MEVKSLFRNLRTCMFHSSLIFYKNYFLSYTRWWNTICTGHPSQWNSSDRQVWQSLNLIFFSFNFGNILTLERNCQVINRSLYYFFHDFRSFIHYFVLIIEQKKPLGLMQILKKTQEKRSTLRNEELERTKRQYNFFW